MATIHEISSAKDGASFISLGPVEVIRQTNPKTSKNSKLYSTAFLKNSSSDVILMLWDQAAQWKLPIGVALTLRGKFTKTTFNGQASVNCDELSKPEGAVEVKPEDIQKPIEKPTIKECIKVGLRAAEYMILKERPELAEAAFSFAANATLQGAKPD
jgi:hypothetical protein